MDQKGTFSKIEKTEKRMYGPKALLICGYPVEERAVILDLIDKTGLAGFSVIFASSGDLDTGVGEVLRHDNKAGIDEPSDMSRAVIMSGLKQNELHSLMGTYRKAGFPRQIWATLTPVSEKWPLRELLKELKAEDRVMKKR
jgi:hypothetical protein